VRYQGRLYRALNPVWAHDPLSGEGARLFGGRFNAKGVPAIYTSTSVLTALREANQAGTLQPTTVVEYHADVQEVFDTRDPTMLAELGYSLEELADSGWRDKMKSSRGPRSQELACQLLEKGFNGLLVRSFAAGALETDLNLVLWRWSVSGATLSLVDDEGRLRSTA